MDYRDVRVFLCELEGVIFQVIGVVDDELRALGYQLLAQLQAGSAGAI